jgi:hypothetical protein
VRQTGNTERQVHDVVQHRNLKQSKQFRAGVMAGEAEHVEVGRDAGYEAQHAGEQERRAHRKRRHLHRRPAGRCSSGLLCCHRFAFLMWSPASDKVGRSPTIRCRSARGWVAPG